jgi:hypothetical protein
MRLRIRAIQLRVKTASTLCGADLRFEDGLVIIRADNSSGKSTVVQSMIYALGLEGMLSASHDVPLPHVMTDSIEIDAEKMSVVESGVAVEIENADGRIVTVFRPVKSTRNKNLVSVADGACLTADGTSLMRTDYFVREGGAAVNERGFHHWFATFAGWRLPKVGRVDGTECPLYVECVFPLMIIEQKRGWSAIQARMPFHYRIRDVAKKSVEFLLALDVYELALRRQKLREEAFAIRAEWNRGAVRIADLARSINAVVQNLDTNSPSVWDANETPVILVSTDGNWRPFGEAVRSDFDALQQLEETEIPRVERVAQEVEAALNNAETELAEADFTATELFHEVENEQQQLGNLDERLAALEEDERRNKDIQKLRRMGSVENTETAHGRCPTCHQAVSDALLPQADRREPMTAEESLKFIRSQIDTFSTIKEAAAVSLTAKQRRLDSMRQRAAELRARIRALRQTLVTEGSQPSIEAIEQRLRLRDKVNTARRIEEVIATEFEALRGVGLRWKKNQEALAALPKGDLTERDRKKLQRFQEIFISEVQQFGLTSVEPASLRISEENYRPEHDGFDLEFDISASDMIRTIWAYLNGLLELSREVPTNHLGLLVLDEPKQQETARVSFRELFRRAASTANHKQQIIIATSEDETTLTPLLDGVAHQYISFSGRIVRPLPAEAEPTPQPQADEASDESGADEDDDEGEMPWEEKARSAVERALENMDLDSESGVIRLTGFNDESLSANSREELERRLRSIASDAWYAYVPFDGGEAVFDCDEWGIVENAIGRYEEQIDEFFAPDDGDGDAV